MTTYELILDEASRKFFCSLLNHSKLDPIAISECYGCGCEICERCVSSYDPEMCDSCGWQPDPKEDTMQQSQNRRIDKIMHRNHEYDHEVSECASSCKIMFKNWRDL